MNIEYEATYSNINKEEMRSRLQVLGAKLVKPEFLQKRVVFNLPKGHEGEHTFIRVRDEQDKITMSYKEVFSSGHIEDQKEICLTVDNFQEAVLFLRTIGCQEKSYQETKRELWNLNGVEITIDEWPFLEPVIEIEGKNEAEVQSVCEQLGFDYSQAHFGSISKQYVDKYHISYEIINQKMPRLTFEDENPFLSYPNSR
ncbi:MAG: CYTH domain-containing protein [Planctomycetes bacterium]|nr:CYTH domain-containing protein [Planctomycetota bacterium]